MFSQSLLGAVQARKKMLKEYGKIQDGLRVLDIGCGPGFVVKFLGNVEEYIGFDINANYISYATKKYGAANISFRCEFLNEASAKNIGKFDLILMGGLLHHLSDQESIELLSFSKLLLKPDGCVLTLDGCYVEKQSRLERWLLDNDRGKFVRDEKSYLNLSSAVFKNNKASLHSDYMNLPYTLIIQKLQV